MKHAVTMLAAAGMTYALDPEHAAGEPAWDVLIRHSRSEMTIAPLRGYLLHLVGMATR
jgi:hypothetical protein